MSFLPSLRDTSGASAAVEITATRVAGANLEWRAGRPVVVSHAFERLPDGALVSSLTAANVLDREAVAGAVGRVLERLGRPKRIALVVPDPVAKVSLIRLERVPSRANDLAEIIRWQVRKAAPFAIDEAQVSFVAGQGTPEGQEFVVCLARREIIEEYEGIAAAEGAHAGVVDLATFNVVNAVLASDQVGRGDDGPAGDWLLVNVAPDYATLAILRGPHLIFFRNRAADTDGTLADLVHQTAMYYEDRLNGVGFARVLLAGASGGGARQAGDVEVMRRSLEERLRATVDTVDPRTAVALDGRISVGPSFLDTLAPLIGILLRGQEHAA
ncbi:MAG TPA: pilus assembly protein PilM [Vicinamibacterales bacterium]|nr:pilus assembly protein PilM [Vicinamibacterales bacterium]